MVIEISNMTYRVGCGIGYDKITIPSLLTKLNTIIEWDFSRFPPLGKDKSPDDPDKEDREFLGPEPELKVGSVFKLGNQLLAIEDPDTIVLVMSETGIGGLKRVWDEQIEPELNFAFNVDSPNSLTVKKVSKGEIPDTWEFYNIKYIDAKIWKDRFFPGRPEYNCEEDECLKVEMESDSFILPIHLYLKGWGFFYNTFEMEDPDELKMCANQMIKWFYDNYPRLARPMEFERADKEKKDRLDAMQGFLEAIKNSGNDPTQQQNP